MYCGNCGNMGHMYKSCTEPITSIGLIVYKKEKLKNEYLMIRRRNTLGFVEFLRGKYTLDNYKYIVDLFSIMTQIERELIVSKNFYELWDILWMNKDVKQYHNEFNNSKNKFKVLKNGLNIFGNKKLFLKDFHAMAETKYTEPEWGFPKGRRNLKESDLECAIREFGEETGLMREDYKLNENTRVFEETFLGTNNIRYKHSYFIAEWISDKQIGIDMTNIDQISEISAISWFNIEECQKKIRDYNYEKKVLIVNVEKYLSHIILE